MDLNNVDLFIAKLINKLRKEKDPEDKRDSKEELLEYKTNNKYPKIIDVFEERKEGDLFLINAEADITDFMSSRMEQYCSSKGIRDQLFSKDKYKSHSFGLLGQFAFCLMTDIYPDTAINTFLPYDAIYNKCRIEIKTTNKDDGDLLDQIVRRKDGVLDVTKINKCDLYCLMILQFPNFRCAGFITSRDFINARNISNNPKYNKRTPDGKLKPPPYCVEQNRLVDLEQIMTKVRK